MYTSWPAVLAVASSLLSASVSGTPINRRQGQTLPITPHDKFSSSIGVLGCKLANVDRIAYFPGSPDCNNICKRISHEGRSITVMHIDSSGGAHDISYSAYNFLITGQTPDVNPIVGGAVDMTVEDVPMDQCADLLPSGKLPFSAPTGTNLLVACPPGSFVRDNFELFNINTSQCTIGIDEPCTLDPTILQPVCPSGVGQGAATFLTTTPVFDFVFGTSQRVQAV